MSGCVITCGAYGFSAETFTEAVIGSKPDVFVDVRRRRGIRGHDYTFGNSARLQAMLVEHDIPYVHRIELAAPEATVKREGEIDKQHGIARHDRDSLSPQFIHDYDQAILTHFDARAFIESLGENIQRPLLFCVERTPAACHRGLLAQAIADQLGWQRLDLVPD